MRKIKQMTSTLLLVQLPLSSYEFPAIYSVRSKFVKIFSNSHMYSFSDFQLRYYAYFTYMAQLSTVIDDVTKGIV